MNREEEKYYQRQMLLPEIGEHGQKLLNNGKVLVIGAGGLGCPVVEFLARAGVGKIGLVDGDTVDITNLHRQSLYAMNDVGLKKVDVAQKKLQEINPFITIAKFPVMFSPENAFAIMEEFDIIVDATDNYPVRYLINDACVIKNKPLVYGAIYRFEGQVSIFNYKGSATYRCLFPNFPSASSNTNCATAGVLGILPGIIGLMQANEVIKILLKQNNTFENKLITYNAKSGLTTSIKLARNSNFDYSQLVINNKLNHPYYSMGCDIIEEINEDELIQSKKEGLQILLIDVREPSEQPEFIHQAVFSLPMSQIENAQTIPDAALTVVFCKSGIRSKNAQRILLERMPNKKIVSLKGGISPQIIEVWKQNL